MLKVLIDCSVCLSCSPTVLRRHNLWHLTVPKNLRGWVILEWQNDTANQIQVPDSCRGLTPLTADSFLPALGAPFLAYQHYGLQSCVSYLANISLTHFQSVTPCSLPKSVSHPYQLKEVHCFVNEPNQCASSLMQYSTSLPHSETLTL